MARGRFGFFLFAAVLCAGGPVAVLAQTTHLMVTKSGNGVVFARAPRVTGPRQAGHRLPPPLPQALRGMVHSRAVRAGGGAGSPAAAVASLAAAAESRAPAVFAEASPSPEAVDPVGLTVTKTWNAAKNNWNLNMAWSGSAGPFDLVYAPAPTFQSGVATLAKETTSTSFSRLAIPGAPLECYEVTDTTVSGEAVQGMGYTPEPAPAVPTASGNGLWWGDPVTFTSSYLDPIAKGNVALMFDRAARATSTNAAPGDRYATTATFTIPNDARGFAPYLSVHGRSSSNQGAPFISLYPKGIAYTAIRGVAYAPQTGRVWVAADAMVQDVDVFLKLPSVAHAISAGLAKPYISKVTNGGKVLYVDGVLGVATVYQADVNTGAATIYASTTDTVHSPPFTRPIRPVGIAVEPDGSACYIADANLGRVVRIPANNATAITDNWGAYTWSFPDPCGMDAYAGLVFVGSTGAPPWVGEITGAASTYLYEYTQAVAYGIEIERDISTASQIYYIYAGDPGIAEAYNKNGIEDVAGTPVRNHGALLFGLANGRLAVAPDWDYFVYHHWPQRVVVNNSGQNEAYPSSFQQADQIIRLDIAGWPGRYEQVRVIDPPDLSPYAPDTGCLQGSCTQALPYEAGDNYGAGYGLSNTPGGPWTATVKLRPGQDNIPSDTTDNLALYLKVPARYSGNNFQAEVTKCDAYGTPMPTKVTGLSSVYTSWKRVYVERDSMFRRGGVLYQDYGATGKCGGTGQPLCCGTGGQLPCNQIKVYDWTNAAVNDTIVVFDESTTAENGGEQRTISAISASSGGTRIITLNAPLSNRLFA